MSSLSISAAWDETKAILARDGQLYLSVALAMIALPVAVNSLVNPAGMSKSSPWWANLVGLVAWLIGVAAQLAVIRLALGPSVTVGGAIVHALRRLPMYIASVLIILLGFALIIIPLSMALVALGVPLQAKPVPASPILIVVSLLFFALVIFLTVRFIVSAAVASGEQIGPIAILQRSWRLTAGHFWPMLGFLILYLVGTILLLTAVVSAVGAVVGLLLGPIHPLSPAALILALVQALVSAAVSTLFFVMIARIYAQLVRRSEVQASVPSSGI
jgi:hypothetical protein